LKRVIKIGGISLVNPLFISSEFDIDNFIGSNELTTDGSSVMFVQAKGSMTKEVQVYSKSQTGWVDEDVKVALTALVGVASVLIQFDDLSTETYYFDHTQIPLLFDSIYAGSTWYTVTINLVKG